MKNNSNIKYIEVILQTLHEHQDWMQASALTDQLGLLRAHVAALLYWAAKKGWVASSGRCETRKTRITEAGVKRLDMLRDNIVIYNRANNCRPGTIRAVLDLCQSAGFANAKTFSVHAGIKIETARDRLIGAVYGGFLTVYHIDFMACYAVTGKGIDYLRHSDLIGEHEVDRAYNSIVQNRVSSATRQFLSLKTPQQLAMGA